MRASVLFLGCVLGTSGAALHAKGRKPQPPASTGTVVSSIEFEGNASIPDKELRDRLSLRTTDYLTPEQLDFSRSTLRALYQSKGYWEVRVDTEVSKPDPRHADIRFSIREGPLFRVRSIKVEGNRLIKDRIVTRELGVKPGDPFSQTDIYRGHRQVFLTGYFDKIDISYSTAPDHMMDLLVRVRERPTRYVKGSVGYGAQSKERVTLGYEDRNFFGNARKLNIQGTYSGFLTNPQKYRTTILQTSLSQPHLLNTNIEGMTSVSREYRERESYDSITTAWRSTLNRRFGESITAGLRMRYDGTSVSNVVPEAAAETAGFYKILGVGPNFNYDDTDDIFLPTDGWRLNGTYEQGLTFGLGSFQFYKTQFSSMRFTSWRGFTFMWMTQEGVIVPDDRASPIPIPERFTLGGANSVRGYSERDLGPKDANGKPLGGEAFAASTVEFRHPLYKKLHGVIFLDGGQLWSREPESIWPHIRVRSLDDLRYGTGFGFRFLSPVGPIRLEFGYKVNPPPEDESFWNRTEVHFALGEAF